MSEGRPIGRERRGSRLSGEGLRYLLSGALNSGATYVLYLLLLRLVPYGWAYSLSYAAGIVLSFVVNSLFVFRVPLDWRRLVPYPSVYALQYGLGLALLHLGVELLDVRPELMPLLVLLVTTPVSFFVTRWLLRRDRAGRHS